MILLAQKSGITKAKTIYLQIKDLHYFIKKAFSFSDFQISKTFLKRKIFHSCLL